MQTITLNIEDSFYPHFQVLLESLEKDKKIEILKDASPQKDIVNSLKEVQKPVKEEDLKRNFLTENELLKIREDSTNLDL